MHQGAPIGAAVRFWCFLWLNGLVVRGLYLCNPCNPWLYKMVHAQVMLWCLDGLTGLCVLCVTGLIE